MLSTGYIRHTFDVSDDWNGGATMKLPEITGSFDIMGVKLENSLHFV